MAEAYSIPSLSSFKSECVSKSAPRKAEMCRAATPYSFAEQFISPVKFVCIRKREDEEGMAMMAWMGRMKDGGATNSEEGFGGTP